MTKLVLCGIIVFSLTACHERRGPEPETSKYIENSFVDSEESTRETNLENESMIVEIPILNDDLPVLQTPVTETETESIVTPNVLESSSQIFSGGKITDGLDMTTIRSSQTDTNTRLVFDSSRANTHAKSKQSGHYSFTYSPEKKQITAIINGYRKFSALGAKETRTFPSSSIIKNIKRVKMMDDSGFKFIISLNKSAFVNVFELKEPARIVVDIKSL